MTLEVLAGLWTAAGRGHPNRRQPLRPANPATVRMHPRDVAEYRNELLRFGVGLTGIYRNVQGSEWAISRDGNLHFNGVDIVEDAAIPRGTIQFP